MIRKLIPSLAILVAVSAATLQAADKGADKTDREVARVAKLIDSHVKKRLARDVVIAAPIADDAEFMRRAYLSIAGRIPRISESHAFLDDKSPDKRKRLVKQLLETPGYITHYTSFWRTVLMPEVNADFQARFLLPGFEAWLRDKLKKNDKYDAIVRELLTVKFEGDSRNYFQRFGQSSPLAFYQAKQAKPENLAAAVSRMFLGVRIECAQCHDHPFDSWKREQFWGMAAFFAGLQRDGNNNNVFTRVREVKDRREIAIPGTKTVVQAKFLTGKAPQFRFRTNARETLAKWVTAKDNPYFARMAVNRVWHKLFGVGIVDPVDDFGASNEPSHPELLKALAEEFVKHDYDLKFLIRAIAASRTYQRTSRRTDVSQSNPQSFARMAVQGMTPEQLFDSLSTAVGYYQPYQSRNPFSIGQNNPRSEIMQLFANDSEAPAERTTTILQALALMNGKFIADATDADKSKNLAAIIEMPFATTADRIEALYLATLSRKPRPGELKRLVAYVKSGGPRKSREKALGDVFWSLLNSSEFSLNH